MIENQSHPNLLAGRIPSRRSFLRVGTLSGMLSALPWYSLSTSQARDDASSPQASKKCILIWLDGGPSHLEMFDPKPSAPAEVRGPLDTIQTAIPDIRFSECLPQLAQRAKDLAVIRSMTSPLGEHNLGTHYLLTGYKPTPAIDYPAYGTVFTHLTKSQSALPSNVAIPNHRVGGSNFSPSGFLGQTHRPFDVGGDPATSNFQVQDLDWYPNLSAARTSRRQEFLDGVEKAVAGKDAKLDSHFEQAFRLLQSESAKKAFDLSQESPKVRNRYGNKSIGQCCLLARRLLEHGVQFVTVNNKGWDTHDRMTTRLKDGYDGARIPVGLIPSMDQAVATLMDELKERGLWDDTLIVVMGEFGRTPKLNVNAGRDHWPRAFSVMLAGGGIRGGTIYGESDEKGESPRSNPVVPPQLIATLYRALGIDHRLKLQSPTGRPISISAGQSPIEELLV